MISPTPPPLPPTQEPIPVQPLGYTPPASLVRGRPALLTTIGVLSITLGSLSILFGSVSSLVTFGFTMVSQAARSAAAAAVATPAPAGTPTTTGPTAADPDQATTPAAVEDVADDADGLKESSRKAIVAGLTRVRPLSERRQAQLDALLAQDGRKILPLTNPAPATVAANVTDAGHYPSGTGNAADGADFFVLARGRIEVTDRHAVFYPSGNAAPIRAQATEVVGDTTQANDATDSDDGSTAAGAGQPNNVPTLTDAEIRQVFAALEMGGHKLTPAQGNTIRAQLSKPTQALFNRQIRPLTAQIVSTTWTNGTVRFQTYTGFLRVGPTGSMSTASSLYMGPGTTAFPPISAQLAMALLSSVLSVLLAVLLLVAGALTLRNSPAGRRLHLVYAWVKLPLVLATLGLYAWTYHVISTAGPSSPVTAISALGVFVVVAEVVALGYPVFLLVALGTRTAKEFYAPNVLG